MKSAACLVDLGLAFFSFFLGSPEYNGQGLDSHENHWALKNDKVSQNQ